jgi:hypothetical protein
MDAAAMLHCVSQRMVEGGVVKDTQVAAKPDKRLAFRNHRVFSQQGRPFYGLGSICCATQLTCWRRAQGRSEWPVARFSVNYRKA